MTVIGDVVQRATGQSTGKSAHIHRQAWATIASSMLSVTGGLTFGYTAVLLPQLDEDDSFEYDKEYDSLIASIAPLAMMLGCLFSGTVSDALGRKTGQLILVVPYSLAWIIMSFANNNTVMLIGRFLTGLCTGSVRPLTMVYIGELSTPKYRSITLFVPAMAINVGSFLSHTVGKYVYWRISCFLFIIPNILCAVILLFLKESPIWLITNGKIDQGIESFKLFRGEDESSMMELNSVLEKNKTNEDKSTFKDTLKIVFSKPFLKSLAIIFWISVAVQWCGINTLSFYAQEIYQKTFNGEVDAFMLMLVTDGIRAGISVLVCIVAHRLPRKITYLSCCCVTIVLLILLVVDLYINPDGLIALAVTLMVLYLAVSSTISVMAWAFIAEIFPSKVRGFGSGLSTAMSFILLFSSVQATPSILAAYGGPVIYGVFAAVTLVATVFLGFTLPETNGRTLQDIENTLYHNDDKKAVDMAIISEHQTQKPAFVSKEISHV